MQTKFTPAENQDRAQLPYDADKTIAEQVHASVASSLHHLRAYDQIDSSNAEAYIDCVLLHSPFRTEIQTMEAWQTLEQYVPHTIRHLGICNVSLPILKYIYTAASVKPTVVQNRFCAAGTFNELVRRFCHSHAITFQPYSVVRMNSHFLRSEPCSLLAKIVDVEAAVVLFALVSSLGDSCPLVGTTGYARMLSTIQGISKMEDWVFDNRDLWAGFQHQFKVLLRVDSLSIRERCMNPKS